MIEYEVKFRDWRTADVRDLRKELTENRNQQVSKLIEPRKESQNWSVEKTIF